ncbi:MAG: Chitinase [Myxococcales bacterium]|nr:Chitinase [Myxococcales bacterium]
MEDCGKTCPSRRHFCAAAGAGLLLAGLPGCDPGAARLGEGALDNNGMGGGGTGGNGSTNHDMSTQPSQDLAGQPPHDLAGQPPQDLAGQPPGDMATAPSCTPGTVSAGAASTYTVGGTPKYFKSGTKELFVVRDAGGLYALTALCTHSGCTNQVKGSQFYCPCHGATFDFNGEKPTSPAFSSLKHYALCVDASGNVTVDPTKTVPATTRV